MSENRPVSPLDNVFANAANIEQLINKQNEMEGLITQMYQMMHKLQEVQLKPQTDTKLEKDAKMPDVREFSGNHQDFSQFEVLLESFFRNQPSRFAKDFSKIDYIGTRLVGTALDWFTAFKLGEKKTPTELSNSFSAFWARFTLAFADPNEADVAENDLFTLKQGSMHIRTFITKFESIRARTTSADDRIDVFIRAMNNSTRKDILNHARGQPELKVDYLALRSWLLQGVSNNEICKEEGVIPMDLSRIEQNSKNLWKFMPQEEYQVFKKICVANQICYKCREFKGHRPGCTLNTAASTLYLSVINEGSLRVDITLPNHARLPALIDTGAQGTALMHAKLASKFKLPVLSVPKIALKAFDGSILDYITLSTAPLKCQINGNEYAISFLIVNNLKESIILGLDWLRTNSVVIDCVSGTLSKKSPPQFKPSKKSPQQFKSFSLRLVEISDSDDTLLPYYLEEFSDVFDLAKTNCLPKYNKDFAMPITLVEGAVVPQSFPYKLSLKEEEALKHEIEKGLDTGKISCSDSFGSSPVLFVKKTDGELRMCVDYRKLNEITVPTQAILPDIQEVLASLGDQSSLSPLYSKIDLKGAFNLLRLTKDSENLSTFVTKFGKFKYHVIPFGLKNAPGHFQDVMNRLFANLIGQGVYVYIDDILIYEREREKHMHLLKQVLRILGENGLVANLKKCQFMLPEVEFLGFKLGQEGIKMVQSKVDAINAFQQPRSVKQLQSFLGVCNFYRTFIPLYTKICMPLLNLLKKSAQFHWTSDCHEAFLRLKDAFQIDRFLALPDRREAFYLFCDSSNFAIGAALHQRSSSGDLQPIAFFSRKLTESEKNYAIYDKELLAIKEPLSYWRHLLISTAKPIQVFTDHDNLTFFKSAQKLNQRQARWQQFLADYNFCISYISGAKNCVADFLSRRADFKSSSTKESTLLPSSYFLNSLSSLPTSSPPHESPESRAARDPTLVTAAIWPIFMFRYLTDNIIPESLPLQFKKRIKREKDYFSVKNGELFRKVRFNRQEIAVPYLYHDLRTTVMKETHETLGHLGLRATFPSLLVRYWWPGIRTDYEKFCKSCSICQMYNTQTRPRPHPRHPLPDPGVPFHTWHLDFIQDLPVTDSGNSQILIAVDRSTRYSIAKAFPSRETSHVLGFIHQLCTQYGYPHRIITDRASYFLHDLADYCNVHSIKLDHSSAYHPQTNALVERTNGVLESILRKSCNGIWAKWDIYLETAVLNLNARHHSVTGHSPFYLAHGISPRLPLGSSIPQVFNFQRPEDRLLYTVRELENLGQARAAALFNSNAQARNMVDKYELNHKTVSNQFVIGQFVKRIRKRLPSMMIPKLASRWEGPFIIYKVGPNDSYVLKKPNGELEPHPVNANHLAPFVSSQDLNLITENSAGGIQLVFHKRSLLPSGLRCVISICRATPGEGCAISQ